MKYLILAGGFATRLWPLSEGRAKPLLLLDGKTILAHILEKIPKGEEIIILTNKRFEKDFEEEMIRLNWDNYKIFPEDSFGEGEKLGALGAISEAINYYNIDENIMVLAGDNLLPEIDFDLLNVESHQSALVVYDIKDLYEARKFGVVEIGAKVRENVHLVGSFEEKPETPKSTMVSTAFIGIGKELLPLLQDFAKKEPDALGGCFIAFLKAGKEVLAVSVSGDWFDVGSFETYLEAHKIIQKQNLTEGSSVILSNNTLTGKNFVGAGSEVRDSILKDCIIYPDCIIKDCQLSSCVISENVQLKSVDLNNKIIRKGVRL